MLLKQRKLSAPRFDFGSTPTVSAVDNSWVGSLSLKRIARPDLEHERHRDTSLRISIHESKNLPINKRYFCDICLDRKLYARTTSKVSTETVFWGEIFDLNNLSELNFITINLYREADSTKDPSKRRKCSKPAQNQLIAFLTIAVADLSPKLESQQWHTMTNAAMLPPNESIDLIPHPLNRQSLCSFNSPDVGFTLSNAEGLTPSSGWPVSTSAKRSISLAGPTPSTMLANRMRRLSKPSFSGSESKMNGVVAGCSSVLPQIRLAVQYQSIDVLPLSHYDDLRKLVVDNSLPLVQYLEPLLQTKRKEEIARCLVNIHEKAPESEIAVFLTSIVEHEVESYDDLSLLFRSNSIGSKAMEGYIKLVGTEYLQKVFHEFIENLITSAEDLEVDPLRLTPPTPPPTSDTNSSYSSLLHHNQTALVCLVKAIWQRLQASLAYFPTDLRETLSAIRRTVELRHGQEVGERLVSGCLFLRYLCPAIHGPTLFGLTSAVPDDPRTSRNLTLLAKVLQTIANFSHFETKESYMRFLNDFVGSMQEEMHQFLRAVSTCDGELGGDESDIWKRQQANKFDCHKNIDLGYELTVLYRHLSTVVKAHPEVPGCLHELPRILEDIDHMISTPTLIRSVSSLGGGGGASMRSVATTPSLDHAAAIRAASFRFHDSVTPLAFDCLQVTPTQQPNSPVSFFVSGADPTPLHLSSGECNTSCEVARRKQAFFGDSFKLNNDLCHADLDSISEKEVQYSTIGFQPSSPEVIGEELSSVSKKKTLICENSDAFQKPTSPRKVKTSASLEPPPNALTPLKLSSGPELNFPPPPMSVEPIVAKDAPFGGSSTNIRMGTQAIRMSRDREPTEGLEFDEKPDTIQLSPVPVIMQCDQSSVPRHSPHSLDSRCSSSSPLSQTAFSPGNANSPNQTVVLAEKGELSVEQQPSFAATPSALQRCIRGGGEYLGNKPALFHRVHNLLFGEGNNEHRNAQPLTKIYPSPQNKQLEFENTDSRNIQALEKRLWTMEQQLSHERKNIQTVVESNQRIIDNQERCINDLIEEINRLQSLRQRVDERDPSSPEEGTASGILTGLATTQASP